MRVLLVGEGENEKAALPVLVCRIAEMKLDWEFRYVKDRRVRRLHGQLPRALGVAILTFDAWMLADQQALSEVLGIDVQQQPEPEENRHPKQDCEILCARARDISLSQLYKGVCERVRIELLASRCPRGFATFAERVRGMAAAGN